MDCEILANELVRAVRGELSQSYINRKLGCRGNQVHRWETGARRISWRDFTRLADVSGVDVRAALRSHVPNGASVDDTVAILGRIIGGAPLTDVSRATGISRYALMRWTRGTSHPHLADILNVIQNCQFTLFEVLRSLVDVERLPSVREAFLARQRRKAVYYRRPEVAAILCCLRLDSYRELPQHEEGYIARKIGITPEDERDAIADLVEVGKIRWNGSHYIAVEEQLELTDSREFSAFCEYWLGRASDYVRRLPNPHPIINYGMDIYPTNEATLGKLRDEYKYFYKRIRAILQQDKGPRDRICVFNALFFDLERTPNDTDGFLWEPVHQPTNRGETTPREAGGDGSAGNHAENSPSAHS